MFKFLSNRSESSILLKAVFFVLSALSLASLSACGGSSSSVSSASNDDDEVLVANLSGEIAIERFADVDPDKEQPFNLSLNLLNNTPAEARFITNPVTLGGYLSGLNGSFSNNALENYFKDPLDYYQVRLVEDQVITLSAFYADSQDYVFSRPFDVSLRLLDAGAPAVELASVDLSDEGSQTLVVPATDDYIIELEATENVTVPLLYTLSISQSLSNTLLSSSSQVRLSMEKSFVPGEVLVRYKDEGNEATKQAATNESNTAPQRARSTPRGQREIAKGLRIKRQLSSSTELYEIESQEMQSMMRFTAGSGLSDEQQAKWQTLQKIEQIKQDPNVEYAEPNYFMRATSIDDPQYAQQWNLPMLEVSAAWAAATGSGVSVAVIDTGIHSDHEDLAANISPRGYDFVSYAVIDQDGETGRDNNPYDPGTTYHGSHVAGTVAAAGNSVGIRGVAFEAEILPLRALGASGEGTITDIRDAVLYAAGFTIDGQTLPEPVDIINLSLGSDQPSATLEDAIEQALDAGVIVVAAAGNESSSLPFYPAAYDYGDVGVIAVSSINAQKRLSGFSNRGEYIDVTAPGGTHFTNPLYDGFQDGILSTVYADEYGELTGTSMAAPHVAGVFALMKELNPGLTPATLQVLLDGGNLTEVIDISGVSAATEALWFGNGLINASMAVGAAGGAVPDTLVVAPAELGFLDGAITSELLLSNPGDDGLLVVDGITASEAWLSVAGPGGNGLGTWEVEVDLGAIVDEIASAELDISYRIGAGPVQAEQVPVFVSKVSPTAGTVGSLNVYLVRWEDIENAEESGDSLIDIYTSVGGQLDTDEGVYRFEFADVPEGLYVLEASTDNDADFIWFDLGEARGAYPLLSESQIIQVQGEDLSDLNFDVGYQSFLNSSASAEERPRPLMKRAP